MSSRSLYVLAAALLFAAPAVAQPKEARPTDTAQDVPVGKLGDPLVNLLNTLHGTEVEIEGNINDIPLFELLLKLSKRHNVNFVINEEAFRDVGVNDYKDKKPNLAATQLRGLTLHAFLTEVFDSTRATYMIRGKVIEIVPPAFAAREAKIKLTTEDMGDFVRVSLPEPLVSAAIKEMPLADALAQLAERYDLSVVVSPQAGDAKGAVVTARLLNVPADKAIELLATQNDLRVVRKGNAFLVTSKEHVNAMFAEKMEKERAKIELEKFREAPPAKKP